MEIKNYQNLKINILAIFFIFLAQANFAQSEIYKKAKIIDAKTKEPVSFATIFLKKSNLGLYANEEGDFGISKKFSNISDTLLISTIGYKNKIVLISKLKKNQLNIIYLNSIVEQLNEVSITTFVNKRKKRRKKRIRSRSLIREAIKRIPENYPTQPFEFISYYRDYLKKKNKYYNMNEAIVQTIDSGFNSLHYKNKFRLLDYSKNKNFPRETSLPELYDTIWQTPNYERPKKFIPYARLPNQGGNELFILLAHNPIRNYKTGSFSFIHKLSKDFLRNHSFKKPSFIFKGDLRLCKINFSTRKEIIDRGSIPNPEGFVSDRKSHYIISDKTGKVETDAVLIEGEIIINPKDYTIHKIKYTAILESTNKRIYGLDLEYGYLQEDSNLMGLHYISFNNEFFGIDHNDEDYFKVVSTKRTSNSIIIRTNSTLDPNYSKNKNFFDVMFQQRKIKIKRISAEGKNIRLIFDKPHELNLPLSINVRNVRDINGRVINQKKVVRYFQYRELFVQQFGEKVNFTTKCYLKNKPLSKNCISNSPDKDKFLMNSPLGSTKNEN